MNRNSVKRAFIGLIAVVTLGWSLWILGTGMRNLLLGHIHLQSFRQSLLYFASPGMLLWLTWMSIRGLRICAGFLPIAGPRLKMWRIFLGVLLLLSQTRSWLDSKSNRYQTDDIAQAIGMYLAGVVIFGVAIWLIRSAFPRRQRRLDIPQPDLIG
jgi:hypothetical protein